VNFRVIGQWCGKRATAEQLAKLDRPLHAATRSFSTRVVTVVRHISVTKKCRVTTKKSIEVFLESFSARVVIVVRHSRASRK
jgi:hypothetical protein